MQTPVTSRAIMPLWMMLLSLTLLGGKTELLLLGAV